MTVLYMSGQTKNGANKNNRTEKHVWCQKHDYVGGKLVDPPIEPLIKKLSIVWVP